MKSKVKTIAIAAVLAATASTGAMADEPYCREYTETFQIGGRTQNGYGTACLQPDGTWQKLGINYDPAYEQQKQNVVYVIDRQPAQVYYPSRPVYQPVYQPVYSYGYNQPTTYFSFSSGNFGYHNRPYYGYRNYHGHRGHGHGWGHGRGHHDRSHGGAGRVVWGR